MAWIALYGGVAAVVAVAAFVAAEWFRGPGVPASDCPGCLAAIAGLLWPVLILGLAQWAVIASVRPRLPATPDAVPAGSRPSR